MRWWVWRAVITTVIAVVAYPVDAERGQLDWWEAVRVLVTAASFIVASRLWLGLVAVERDSTEWMIAPRRWQTSQAVIDWAQHRYGDFGGLTELRRHRRRFRGPRHERLIWRATAWVPSERAGGKEAHRI